MESCLLQVMQGGWHSWYMMVYVGMFSRDVKCAKSKRCGFSFLEVRCMNLGEDMVHPWFARFCKHNFDVSEMCVCVFSLSKQCWKACLKTSRCIQSYGLWTCWIRIRVVLVPTLMVLLQSSWYPAHRRPWTEIHILAKGGWVGWAGNINVHVPCLHTWMLRCCYVTGHGCGGGDINVHVPCLHTWMLRCCYVTGHGWGGGDINVHVPCLHTWMLRCCYVTGHGWGGGGILTFMYLAYIRGCYAAATSLGMGGVGGDINVHVPCLHTWMLRCCYVTGHGWGGGDINVHVPCLHTWMLRCCYVTGHVWGGGDINVHVPCLHTWMLRCCYVTGHGWGGGDINVHVPCLHTWMLRCCYVTGHGWGRGDINVHVPCLHTWMLCCCYVTGHGWGRGGY